MSNEFDNCDHDVFRALTIMVVMPHGWKGGFFRVAAALCNFLDTFSFKNQRIRVLLGVPSGYECDEAYLLNKSVAVVEVGYEHVSTNSTSYFSDTPGEKSLEDLHGLPLITPFRTLPFGDTSVIGEVDGYILLSALYHDGVFVTKKPYAVYVADFIQRYVPAIYSDQNAGYSASNWLMDRNQKVALKRASHVFATTPQTLKDAISYSGVSPEKISQFPMFAVDISNDDITDTTDTTHEYSKSEEFKLFDLISNETFSVSQGNYFLWVTNASAHKNHIVAFKALKNYYNSLSGKLTCLICGPVTEFLKPGRLTSPYHLQVYKELENWGDFGDRVRLAGYLPDGIYVNLLKSARFLWHNVIYDNGTFSIMEAARVGTPALSSDYPQVRFIDELFQLKSSFFPSNDPNAAANAIKNMENAPRRQPARMINAYSQKEIEASLDRMLTDMFFPNMRNRDQK
jgi:glycosyltransferase involved in cell wall biosynthesis